jgi:hypothetical protein
MFFGSDLEVFLLDELNATIVLRVKDPSQIKTFLENKELQKFLTDPFDMDGTVRGCRIRVENTDTKLVFKREMKKTTMPSVAYLDLVKTISRFIWRDIPEGDWQDLLRGHSISISNDKALWKRAHRFL